MLYCRLFFYFWKNLKLLRTGAGLEMEKTANLFEISKDMLKKYEGSELSIEHCIGNFGENAIVWKMARLFAVPVSELVVRSLFYHIPIKYTISMDADFGNFYV